MFGFKARRYLREINSAIDMMTDLPKMGDTPERVIKALTNLEVRALRAEREVAALRRKYEPTRLRVPIASGGTMVQPTGAGKAPAELLEVQIDPGRMRVVKHEGEDLRQSNSQTDPFPFGFGSIADRAPKV